MLRKELMRNVQIEITSACNLACPNCDRNCGAAKTDERMTVEQINRFVADSIDRGHQWGRIDIIGGEPTLHQDLHDIIGALSVYHEAYPRAKFRLSTNGVGDHCESVLDKLPKWVSVRNSSKEYGCAEFEAVNVAPVDEGHANALACSIPWRCGLGLSRHGFFPCGAGASIARVFGLDIGLMWPTSDEVYEQMDWLCHLCGHSCSTRRTANGQETSKTWQDALKSYSEKRPFLAQY
jgi:hypothetical protein